MHSYKDNNGVTWDVVIDVNTVRKWRSRLSVDVMDNASLSAAMSDPIAVIDMLWVACEPQAEARRITEDDWYRGSIEGNTFEESSVALLEELESFFQRTSRKLMAEMIRATLAARPKIETATTNQTPKIAAKMEEMIAKAEQELSVSLSPSTAGG